MSWLKKTLVIKNYFLSPSQKQKPSIVIALEVGAAKPQPPSENRHLQQRRTRWGGIDQRYGLSTSSVRQQSMQNAWKQSGRNLRQKRESPQK